MGEVVLDSDDKRRAVQIHNKSIIIVMHDHRPIAADIPKMLKGAVTAKVFNFALDVEVGRNYQLSAKRYEGWAKQSLIALEKALSDIEQNRAKACLALSANDIERAKKEGKVAIILGSEGGKLMEGDLNLLRIFYRLGLRELQLTWAFENQLAGNNGLTNFGKDAIREMNRLGVIIDVTHIPAKAFDDVLGLTKQPVIVSHCAARAVTTDLSDKQIRAIAGVGGVLGVHFYSAYLRKCLQDGNFARRISISDLLDQIDYMVNLVGIDHVGLGVDLFLNTGVWADFQYAQGQKEIKWAIRDLSEMPSVTRGLVARGYSDSEVQKILGLNFLRVCKRVFGA